jgi:AraC-type transcriptional regulator N-terminus
LSLIRWSQAATPVHSFLRPAVCIIAQGAKQILLGEPQDSAILAPLVERELLFRLIMGPAGGLIRAIATSDSRVAQISRAIVWLKTHFREHVNGPELARLAGMSLSRFHDHFRRATAMTPL